MLKKLSLFLSVFIIVFSSVSFYSANADSLVYGRVISSDVAFYKNKGEMLFLLPYTYYVKILSKDADFCHVVCYGNGAPEIDGFVATSSLYFDSKTPENPYLNLLITTKNMTAFYQDFEKNNQQSFIMENRELFYYGYVLNSKGETMFLVSYLNKLGYVLSNDISAFSIPLHEEPLPKKEEPIISSSSIISQQKQEDSSSLSQKLKIAILVCIGFAFLIIVLYAFKSKKLNGYEL